MNLFETMTDTTKQIAEMNSGSYRFEMQPNYAQQEEPKASEEEESKSSLYNLLDHSQDQLFKLGLCVEKELLHLLGDEKQKDTFEVLSAWAKILFSAIEERSKRDSEAWAEQTAKEIKEAVK